MRGGKRPGAGRKPGAFTATMSTLLKATVTPADWRRAMRALVVRAAEGDIRAIQLMVRLRYGEAKEGAIDEEYLRTIRIIDPSDPNGGFPPIAERPPTETDEPVAHAPMPDPPARPRRVARGIRRAF